MTKRKIASIFLIIVTLLTGGIGIVGNANIRNNISLNLPEKCDLSSRWRETSIKDGEFFSYTHYSEFDLKKIITEADYVFSGTVVDRKEYEVEWTDDNGEKWGPFPSSVIEVKVNKEYYGKSPVDGDIIRVYYPYSLSTVFEGSFIIKDNGEYVFITQALDQEFVERRKKESPDDRFEQEKYADVYISNPSYSLMAKDNGKIFMYHDYFEWDKNNVKNITYDKSVKTDKMSSSDLIKTGWFISLDEKDFDKSFSQLFEKPEKLPDAEELQKLHQLNYSKN